jgi:clan AA aspartic protease
MGLTYTTIQLTNVGDIETFQRGFIQENEIRTKEISALVDTGALTLVISVEVCRELGLRIEEFRSAVLANGQREEVPITSAVEVRVGGRKTVVNAAVTGSEALLGAIPLEGLDLVVDPIKQILVPHPDSPEMPHLVLKGLRRG